MMRLLIAFALCAWLVALPSCTGTMWGVIVGTGTIRPSQAECSSWFLRADSGRLYELTALSSEFQRDGLRVRFTLKRRDDLASICMVGPIADVVSMRRF